MGRPRKKSHARRKRCSAVTVITPFPLWVLRFPASVIPDDARPRVLRGAFVSLALARLVAFLATFHSPPTLGAPRQRQVKSIKN